MCGNARTGGGLFYSAGNYSAAPVGRSAQIRRSAQRRLTGLFSNGLDLSIQAEQAE
jgi:hypothetical protein